ncbi:MAG: class II fructose-bisphosphatase, partial [Thermus sp.]
MPTRNLGLDLMRATEAAALASARYVGRGDKEGGDQAAVEAMRLLLNSLDFRGRVVIGEGEKDKAPMLYNGEVLGQGEGPYWDLAVDPVEGTRLLALGRPGAISVIAAAPEGTLFNPGPAFYAAKLVVGPEAKEAIDLKASVADNLKEIARALRKEVRELTVFVLDKPRHQRLIEEIRLAGARISLQTDGDVGGALAAVLPDTGIDVLMGTGGTPEGVIAAVAVRALGGGMQMRLDPQSEEERWNVVHAGYDLDRVYTLDELCSAEDTHFAATGITDG